MSTRPPGSPPRDACRPQGRWHELRQFQPVGWKPLGHVDIDRPGSPTRENGPGSCVRRCGAPAIVEKPFAKFEELSYVGAGIRAPVKSLKTLEQVLQARQHGAKLAHVYDQWAASRAR